MTDERSGLSGEEERAAATERAGAAPTIESVRWENVA
jgi:hypothetical protein